MRSAILRSVTVTAAMLFGATALPVRAAPEHGPRLFAAQDCAPRNAPMAAPFAQGTCRGVRPGAVVRMGSGMCTMAFVFRGSDRQNYIATAGHCPLAGRQRERKWTTNGPTATDSRGYWIGNYVYAVFKWTDIGPTYDFALIRLNPGVKPNPKMCHFGGPTRLYQKREQTPSVLKYFGNSPTYSGTLPARSALAANTSDKYYVLAAGASAPGDSGSGVINQRGEAVGVLTGGHGFGIGGTVVPTPDTVFARLDRGVAKAQKALEIKLSLRTAAVSPDTSL